MKETLVRVAEPALCRPACDDPKEDRLTQTGDANRSTTSTPSWQRCRPRSSMPSTPLPEKEALIEVVLDLGPPAGGPLPGLRGDAAPSGRSTRPTSPTSSSTSAASATTTGRASSGRSTDQRDPEPQRQDRRADAPDRARVYGTIEIINDFVETGSRS
jgi:hypothetical protein